MLSFNTLCPNTTTPGVVFSFYIKSAAYSSQVWKMKGNCLLGLCNWKRELGLQTRQVRFRPLWRPGGQSLPFFLLSGTVIRFQFTAVSAIPRDAVPQRSLQMLG